MTTQTAASVAREVERIIKLFNVQADVYRKDTEAESLFGTDDAKFEKVGDPIPIELRTLTPEDIAQKIDASACVLPASGVRREDRLVINGTTYRVQTADPQNWFGTITHVALKLVTHAGN